MATLHIFEFLVLCFFSTAVTQDPCTSRTEVPNIDKRDGLNSPTSGVSLVNDRYLAEGWYGTGDGRNFLDAPPGFQRCGTLYPIWRREKKGNHSTMCLQSIANNCSLTFNITTKLCRSEEIYYLKRAPLRNSAYCFGWSEGVPPDFAETPQVDINLTHTGSSRSELQFLCTFNNHSQDVFYHTNWQINGDIFIIQNPRKWENGDVIKKQALTETLLTSVNITTFGFEVRCSVRVSYAVDNQTSAARWSQRSFIGIKVSNTSLTLQEGQSADITFQLTAPFGCGSAPFPPCILNIEVFNIDKQHGCKRAELRNSLCGKTIFQKDWNEPVSIRVFGKISNGYGADSQVLKLKLRTENLLDKRLWSDYNLGIITVQLSKDTTKIKEKSCHAVNDPHMKTFDRRYYEHQFDGIFTMYKHNTLPIEVQIETAICHHGIPGARCNCGVAVRAGKTVFEVNRCPNSSPNFWTAEYTLCEDGGDVLQVKWKGGRYEVYLPTGGKVDVSLGGSFLNVYIYPSVQDVDNSRGLCGKLSDVCSDDFVMRDGSYSTDPTADGDCHVSPRASLVGFSNSWRVPAKENLFNHDNHESLTSWPKSNTFCFCPEKGIGSDDNPVGNASCSAIEARDICPNLLGFTDFPSNCRIQQRRRRRWVDTASNIKGRLRRQAQPSWFNGWTEERASNHCVQLFQASKSVKVCENVSAVETGASIDDCIKDIQLTGTTVFGSFSIDTVRSKCLHEVVVNPILQEETSTTNQSVFDLVFSQACANDCSDNGECINGLCVCESDYGGDDCSIDLRLPPELFEVQYDGYCDTSRDTCNVISIYGETFDTNGALCLVEEIMVGKKMEMKKTGSRTSNASILSINHVQCNIPATPSGSDDIEFVRAYRISVANSGALYSTSVGVMVYDGRCVRGHINGTDFKWTVEGPFCLYKEECVADKIKHPDDPCLVCDATSSIGIFRTFNTSDARCNDNDNDKDKGEKKDFPVIPVAAGAAGAVVLIVIIIAASLCCLKQKRVQREKLKLSQNNEMKANPEKLQANYLREKGRAANK